MSRYRCQSAWKLAELDAQSRMFARSRCRTVVDLAAAPGGFAQVALERMNALRDTPKHAPHTATPGDQVDATPLVIAVDQRPIEPLEGMVSLQENILDHAAVLRRLDDVLRSPRKSTEVVDPPRPVQVVLHDGVSVVAGQRAFSVTYAQSQMTLSCLQLACRVFAAYGSSGTEGEAVAPSTSRAGPPPRRKPLPVFFASKVMNCAHLAHVTAAFRAFFSHVELHKPKASKDDSRERYLVAFGFKDGLWDAFSRRDADGGLKSGQPRTKAVNVFSLCPGPDDARSPDEIIWHCLGCHQTRMGAVPCPVCTPTRRRSRL